MERQHTENLFRRYKGKLVKLKTMSGNVYTGRVGEITNDYVSLINREAEDEIQNFVFFEAMESLVVMESP